MARNEAIVSIGITLEGKRAQDALKALQASVDLTSKKVEELKKKLYEGTFDTDKGETEETIKKELNRQEKDLKNYQKTYDSFLKVKKGVDDVLAKLSESSYNELTRTRTLLQGSIKSLKPAAKEYKEKIEQLQQLQEEIASRQQEMSGKMSQEKAAEVLAKPQDYSTDELKEAIEVTRKLQSAQNIGKEEWEKYGKAINNAENLLHHYNSEAKKSAMESRLETVDTASPSSLSEQKKYWQEMVRANPAMEAYQDNLKKIVEVERERIKVLAEQSMTKINEAGYGESIEDMQQRLKLLREYRSIVSKDAVVKGPDGKDVKVYDQIDASIEKLKKNIQECEQGFLSFDDALAKAKDPKNLNETVENLERIKKALQEARAKELEIGTGKSEQKIKDIDKALVNVGRKITDAKVSGKSMKDVLENIHTAKLEDLEAVAEELKEEMRGVTRGTEEYIEVSSQLKRVNAAMDRIKKDTQETENVIVRTGKRLASYVAVYATYNQAASMVRRLFDGNLALSDSMADIQKTTGMTNKEVAELGKSIDAIDTRTSQEQLYELAAAAGQLGLKGQEDVLGFTKAANMITVALNELGTEGTTELMKIANLTGDIQKYGTEDALLRIGSAINELTANTAATAGPIGEFISRVGGIASASHVATHEMAAIGATADATGQSMEVAGTTMNKVFTALTSNTRGIAQAVNANFKELDELVKGGKTMDALVMVLDAMRQSGKVTSEAMKELGSDGARMNQFITSLVGNLDMLRDNLQTSAGAFEEMTSVVNEYNVKNESAMGLLQRIGNTLNEIVSNPRVVQWITDLLNSLKSTVDWLVKSEGAVQTLLIALGSLIGLNIVKAVVAWNRSWREFVVIIKLSTKTLSSFVGQLKIVYSRVILTTGALGKLKTALKGVFGIISRFPLVGVVAAVGGLVAALVDFNDEMDEAAENTARNTARMRAEFEAEKKAVDELFNSAKTANDGSKERSELITEINKKYGKYLGYMLDEKTTAEELASAQALVNAELKKRKDLMLIKSKREAADEQYIGQSTEPINRITKQMQEAGLGPKQIGEAIAEMNRLIDSGASYEEILAAIEKQTGKTFDIWREGAGAVVDIWLDDIEPMTAEMARNLGGWDPLGGKAKVKEMANEALALHDLVDARKVYNAEIDKLSAEQAATEKSNNQSVLDSQKAILSDQFEQLRQMKGTEGKALEEREAAYQRFYNQLSTYISQSTGKQKAELEQLMATFKASVKEIPELAYIVDYWGKGDNLEDWTTFRDTIKNLDKASPTNLAATLKKIEEESADISEAGIAGFNKQFGTTFTNDLDKFNEDVKKLASQIRNRLTELGRDVNAGFSWDSNKGKSSKKTAQQLYRELLAELEAYYNERETAIRQNGMKEGRLESEINREIENLQIQEWNDRIEMEKALLGKQSTFDPTKYMGDLTEMPYFAGVIMEDVRAEIQKGGPKLEADIVKSMTGSMVKTEEKIYQIKQRIEKILLEDDFSEQVAQQYLDSIDQLGLLFNIQTEAMSDHSEEEGERRLAYMREWSKESYSLTAKNLQDKMEANAIFGDWVKNRTSEDYEALLIQLRKFHDDQEEADRKSAERRKKIFDNSKEGRALSEQEKKEVGDRENDAEMWDRFQGLDLVTENTTDEAQIAIYQAKIDASNRYIEQIKLEMQAEIDRAKANVLAQQATLQALEMMGASTDEQQARLKQAQLELASIMNQMEIMIAGENESILENQQQISDRYTAMQQRKVEEYKKYSDAVVDWSAKMTEAEWDDVESRKEATKEMVRTLLSYLRDWAAAKLTELTMKAMFSEQSTMIEGGETQKSLTIQGAKADASVALSGVEGTGKEVAKHGLKGLLIGAAITAALTALMNVAMKTLFKSKAEVASASGASTGRLATGMLTYAEGNYPVLGNDGQVYNAKYEGAGMKTGIYGGGAHFGIFSEKKPEAIIDGDTTQRLILNHPDIWQSIVTLSKTGRLDRGMRTFASGNINELARTAQEADATATTQNNEQMLQMQATLDRNSQIMLQLTQVLNQGIHAKIDMYGDGGMYKSMKKAESFASKRGYR